MEENKIFITGGMGYLGCCITQYLLNKGYKIKVFDNLMFGTNPLKAFLDNPGFEFIRGDICDSDLLGKELEGFNTVIHLAAIVGDVPCEKDRISAVKINHEASISLIEQCIKKRIKFIFASTASNYGACPGEIVTEESKLNPVSLYAKTKIAVEDYLKHVADSDFNYTILRFGTAYGLSLRIRSDLWIHFLIKETVIKKRTSVYGLELYRPYIHTSDIAVAIEKVITASPELINREIFNVVEENYNKRELLDILREFCDFKVDFFEKPDDIRDYSISGKKIKDKIGFNPRRKIRDVLPALIQAVELGVY